MFRHGNFALLPNNPLNGHQGGQLAPV
jgi:hypothetical protein